MLVIIILILKFFTPSVVISKPPIFTIPFKPLAALSHSGVNFLQCLIFKVYINIMLYRKDIFFLI